MEKQRYYTMVEYSWSRKFWVCFPANYNYIWVGLIPGGLFGVLTKVCEIIGNDSLTTTDVYSALGTLYLFAVGITALAMLFRKDKPYIFWKRFGINALFVAVGLFSGILLGGVAVWLAIVVLVLAFLATPSGSSRRSSGGTSEDSKCCARCGHLMGDKCRFSGKWLSAPYETVCDEFM